MKFLTTILALAVGVAAQEQAAEKTPEPGPTSEPESASSPTQYCPLNSMSFVAGTTLQQMAGAIEGCVHNNAVPLGNGRCNAFVLQDINGHMHLSCDYGSCTPPTPPTKGTWKWAVCNGGTGLTGSSCRYVPDTAPRITLSAAQAIQTYGSTGMHVKCKAWCASQYDPALGEQRRFIALNNRNDQAGDDMDCFCLTQDEMYEASNAGYHCGDACRNLPANVPCFDQTLDWCSSHDQLLLPCSGYVRARAAINNWAANAQHGITP